MGPNIITSLLGPLPAPTECNIIHTLFHNPSSSHSSPQLPQAPHDYVTHIDGVTGEKRTLNEFMTRVGEVGAAFSAPGNQGGLGLEPGDVVGLLSENCIDYPIVLFALLHATIPVALLNSHSTATELVHQLKVIGVSHLIVGPKSLRVVDRAMKLAGISEVGITVLEGCGTYARGNEVSLQRCIDRTKQSGVQQVDVVPAKPDTLAYLVFSSGTSGLPKGNLAAVMITHGNLNASYAQLLTFMSHMPEEETANPSTPARSQPPVALAFLPMYHTMGLHSYNFWHFISPRTLVVLPTWNPDAVFDCIRRYRVSEISLVPSLIFQLLAHPEFRSDEIDLSSLTSIGAGAAYLPPATEKEFLDALESKGSKGAKIAISNGYGMSEATIAIASQPSEGALGGKLNPILGSVGVLFPGIEARLCHEAVPGTLVEDLIDVSQGEPGELYVRGPNNALGYWKNEKATKEAFLPGNWMRTGDRFIYKEGHFWFQDRVKDTLKVSGVQVSPTEIEEVLKAHPKAYLREVCVAGVPGGRNDGELVPKAWVVLSDVGRKMDAERVANDLHLWVQEQLSKSKHLRGGIEVVESIPRNPTGKVLRRVLQEQHISSHVRSTRAKL